MGTLKVALAQINPTVGDFGGNIAKISQILEEARSAGAVVVAFPEMALCGYPPEDLLLRPRFLEDSRRAVKEVAGKCLGMSAIVGFVDSADGKVYNAAAVVRDGVIEDVYHKMELPNYGVFDEKRYFSPGTGCRLYEREGMPFAVTICEDLWVEKSGAVDCVSRAGARVVFNISASPFHAGKLEERSEVLAGFARKTGATVCYVNLVGGQDELVFDGGSLIMNSRGEQLARAVRFEEGLLVAEIIDGGETLAAAGPAMAPEMGRIEEIYAALILGTRDYVAKNDFEKVVIGLSGGIDSALTAAVAVDALGAQRVAGVTMPSRFSSEETRSDAALLAENLGIELLTVPIEKIYSAYLEELREPFGDGDPGVAAENLQARIRGNLLMALSNRFGWLVLTTGNKSETAVGYSTLYGDMAGGFAVIKDVPKTLVYELSRDLNARSGREVIPLSVIRPPTAELRPDQRDEDSLPPYEALDPILKGYVEEDRAPDEIAAAGFDAELVHEVVRMVDRSEYKRRQGPPGVKITPKAFGRDRRLPITNRYRGRRLPPPERG